MSWDGIKEYKEEMKNNINMPFGKHKGVNVKELPISYCYYLRANGIDIKMGKRFFKAIGSRIWNDKQEL